jgi:hypothetical protein
MDEIKAPPSKRQALTPAVAKQVDVAQRRAESFAASKDLNNLVGRGRLGTGPMGVIWGMLGLRESARAAEASAAMYTSVRTTPTDLVRLDPVDAPRVVAAWPSRGRIREAADVPACNMHVLAAYMPGLTAIALSKRSNATHLGMLRLCWQQWPRLRSLTLPALTTVDLDECLGDHSFDALEALSARVGSSSVSWLARQPWTRRLCELNLAVWPAETKSVCALLETCTSLRHLQLSTNGVVWAEVAAAIPETVTDLSVPRFGSEGLAALKHLRDLTSFDSSQSFARADPRVFFAAHPKLQTVRARFNRMARVLPEVRLPALRLAAIGTTHVNSTVLGTWIAAHPHLDVPKAWQGAFVGMRADGSEWDQQVIRFPARDVLTGEHLTSAQLGELVSNSGRTLKLGASVDVDWSVVRPPLQLHNLCIRRAIDDRAILACVDKCPAVHMLSVRVTALLQLSTLQTLATKVKRLSVDSLQPLTVSDAELDDILRLVATSGKLSQLWLHTAAQPVCHPDNVTVHSLNGRLGIQRCRP